MKNKKSGLKKNAVIRFTIKRKSQRHTEAHPDSLVVQTKGRWSYQTGRRIAGQKDNQLLPLLLKKRVTIWWAV